MPLRHGYNRPTRLFGIQGYFGTLFAVLFMLAGTTLAVLGYNAVTRGVAASVERRSDEIVRAVMREVADVHQSVQSIIDISSQGPLGDARRFEDRLRMLPVLRGIFESIPLLSAAFIGYEDGDFFIVDKIDSEEERRYFAAPPGSGLAVRSVRSAAASSRSEIFFYNAEFALMGQRPDDSFEEYDPRVRRWYKAAMATDEMVKVGPVMLSDIEQPGIVFARRCRSGRAAFGLSLRTDRMSGLLADALPTPGAQIALLGPDGALRAASAIPPLKAGERARPRTADELSSAMRLGVAEHLGAAHGEAIPIRADGKDWLLFLDEIKNDDRFRELLLLAVPREELMQNAHDFLRRTFLGALGCLLVFCPLVWLAARRVALPLRAMSEQSRAVNGTENSQAPRSRLAEIDTLALSLTEMLNKQGRILDVLRSIGSERDLAKLFGQILQETVAISGSNGGGVVLLDAQGRVRGDGFYFWSGGEVREVRVTPPENTDPALERMIGLVLGRKEACLDSVPRGDPRAESEVMRPGFADPAVERVDHLWLCLRDRNDEPLGLLSLFRTVVPRGIGFSPAQISLAETLAASSAIVLETQRLFKAQHDLRDALIQILAGAIDAKSPYTGGHCARVPVIFTLLLEAACADREGPFADFSLDENGWEEAKLAAWLHDCGKVTTPEYVMDKATKMETLYDRIHEIRMRFEVLKRDAEITFLLAKDSGFDANLELRRMQETHRELDDDFAFVASCNLGTETMDDAAVERLAKIGRRTWLRTLDKRLGVSRGERSRMEAGGVASPPVYEPLLADNPEHIIPRGLKDVIHPDNPWGFRSAMPASLYNRGELHNLSIRYGTLTPEERYKINDHIARTIIMLECMPLPKELAAVPEIAGAHHETMDGKGYPRGLHRDEMSWSARMMAVADIFEALTAWDRPYKSGKALSEALRIMDGFKERNHIDPDIYDLFLRSGIPQRYAVKYLRPEQNDLTNAASQESPPFRPPQVSEKAP